MFLVKLGPALQKHILPLAVEAGAWTSVHLHAMYAQVSVLITSFH